MDGPTVLDAAVDELVAAVARLDAAVLRRLGAEEDAAGLGEQLLRMEDDRARLADDLDTEAARSGRLEDASKEVSRRLVAAMESIRTVLERHGG